MYQVLISKCFLKGMEGDKLHYFTEIQLMIHVFLLLKVIIFLFFICRAY